MEVKIYTSPGCYYCTQVKRLFERAGIADWEEIVCRKSEDLKKDCPTASSYPWVVIDGKEIGGLVDTAKHLLEIGLVSANKSGRS